MFAFNAGALDKLPLVLASVVVFSLPLEWSNAAVNGVAVADVSMVRDFSLPETIRIPAGRFVVGSSKEERLVAYDLDAAAYGHELTRSNNWYENELDSETRHTGEFDITSTPITNDQYLAFIRHTGHPSPSIDQSRWESFGLVHPFKRVKKFLWPGAKPPSGRGKHPVVLVNHYDASAYAAWLATVTGDEWRLPTEDEWEKAARGDAGNTFPWGNHFKPELANSHDLGPFDTQPVGQYDAGKSPFGMLDVAGQVYEWTADLSANGGATVKGGSWDDKGCGVCRPAARHVRDLDLKHIIVGFRLVRETGHSRLSVVRNEVDRISTLQ